MLNLDKTACCFLVSTACTDSAVFLEVKKRRNDKNDQQLSPFFKSNIPIKVFCTSNEMFRLLYACKHKLQLTSYIALYKVQSFIIIKIKIN